MSTDPEQSGLVVDNEQDASGDEDGEETEDDYEYDHQQRIALQANLKRDPANSEDHVPRSEQGEEGEAVDDFGQASEPVECVQAAGVVLDLPVSLFEIESLNEILSLDTWDAELSENDRNMLREHLPNDIGMDERDNLKALLDGKSTFNFNNPLDQLWTEAKNGMLNPRLIKYRDGLLYLQEIQYMHALRAYHNNFVNNLLIAKEVWDPEDVPGLVDRTQQWRGSKEGNSEKLDGNSDPMSQPADGRDSQGSKMSERRPKRKPRARPSKPSKWRKLAALNSNKLLGAVRQALLRDTDPNQLGEAAQTNRRFALDDIVNYVVKEHAYLGFQSMEQEVIDMSLKETLSFLLSSGIDADQATQDQKFVTYDPLQDVWEWKGNEEDNVWEAALVAFVPYFEAFVEEAKRVGKPMSIATNEPDPDPTSMKEDDRLNAAKNAQKSISTIPETSKEQKDAFRSEEFARYTHMPTKPFTYTKFDGTKTTVAPVRNVGAGKSSAKARDHFLLIPNRPAHVNILCLVRDASARLPKGIGTRADVCQLIRDSQFLVPHVSDSQLNQVVSGALDRLHYERDPCVKYDSDRKLWCYLHGERSESDFADYDASASRRERRKRD